MERKIILKIVNKIGRAFYDQQQPPQAPKPTTPEIQLLITYNSNHVPLLNTKYDDKQQAANRGEIQTSINIPILYLTQNSCMLKTTPGRITSVQIKEE